MKKYLITGMVMLLSNCAHSNNLQIGPVTFSVSSGSYYLNFTISWENSWRVTSPPGNRDAVWLFVKRRDCAALQWHHANLAPQDTAHSAGNPLFVDAYADKKGVMVYRLADGSGNISNVNVQLKLDSVPIGNYDYQVFGIEMVYVPQGAFYVGDGFSNNSLQLWPTTQPYLISSEDSIQLGQDTGKLFHINSSNPNTGIVDGTTLGQAYPKGFNAFYVMKYEVSQAQYADFLNTLTQDASANRYLPSNSGMERYNLQGAWPQIISTTPDRACNWMSFQDLTALLDWSALSPLTELEYEKLCRGSGNNAVAAEKAWGGITVTDANTIAAGSDGTPTEYVTDSILTGSGLANFNSNVATFSGPLRCGFAARINTNRFQSGSAYYGAMEMSGNLIERCYNLAIYNTATIGGGLFTGGHGDGELTSTPNAGYANVGWPQEGFEPIFLEGYAVANKGGGYIRDIQRLNVADRFFAVITDASTFQFRIQDYGGRGVSRRQ